MSVLGGLDALAARLPAMSSLPRVELGRFPTATQRLEHLSERLGADLWVKRDDLSGEPYGGNKVRKLELLLADARARGARCVLTGGATGSNHVLATAVYGRALGLATHAVVFRQPENAFVRRNAARCRALGVKLYPVTSPLSLPLALARVAAATRADGRRYDMLPGGSTPLGTLGYVAAACELAEQVRAGELPEPVAIWVPIGSAGTAVGLQLGLALCGLRTRVVAVCVGAPRAAATVVARGLGALTRRKLGVGDLAAHALELVDDQVGRGYGHETPAALEALELARLDALALDTTYSAKALAALVARCRSGAAHGQVHLFWNTYNSRPLDDPRS
ncbi:MAG: pyridoxal-phosphate dependent enzyme [Myxococcales bacterium]|nr:pyridoxal-phosphate dependent enzyme [Myxococcales bacterium]